MAVDPITAGFNLGGKITDLIGEWVEDKDLAAKLAFEIQKEQLSFNKTILSSTTTPFVDGLVKIVYALVPLMRPIGSFILALIGIDALPEISEAVASSETLTGAAASDPGGFAQAGLLSLFPGWMYSRHRDKKRARDNELEASRMKALRPLEVAEAEAEQFPGESLL